MKHNGGHNGSSRRPEDILAEIERTRSDINGTLSAIEHRLTPGQLVDRGLSYLRHSGANQFVSNLNQSVKQNPLPVALVGIGLAWLMASGKQPENESGSESWRSTGGLGEHANQAMQHASESIGSARERLGDGMRDARERASHLGETARQQFDRARRRGLADSRAAARARRVGSGHRRPVRRRRPADKAGGPDDGRSARSPGGAAKNNSAKQPGSRRPPGRQRAARRVVKTCPARKTPRPEPVHSGKRNICRHRSPCPRRLPGALRSRASSP